MFLKTPLFKAWANKVLKKRQSLKFPSALGSSDKRKELAYLTLYTAKRYPKSLSERSRHAPRATQFFTDIGHLLESRATPQPKTPKNPTPPHPP